MDFVERSQFEANAALNALEFSNRQITLRGDGAPSFPAPFGAQYWDVSVDPKVLYRQTEDGGSGIGSTWAVIDDGDTSNDGVGGAVFVTDITPTGTGNVGGKVFDTTGNILQSAVADTDLLTVHVLGITGHSNFQPAITVLGQQVVLTQGSEQTTWTGSIDIDRQGAATITASHEDGARYDVAISTDAGPEVESAEFTGGYPGSQTELKAGDQFDLLVETDTDMTAIEVEASGAVVGEVFTLAGPTMLATVTVTIADQGTTTQALGVRLRAINDNGSSGSYFDTAAQGSTDGVHVVNLNNTFPAIAIGTATYPIGQQALKDSETAMVAVSGSDFDTAVFDSPNGDLAVTDPTVMATDKEVERIAGSYNVSTDNFRFTATRTANGAVTVAAAIVNIADAAAIITVDEQQARLRSGGNNLTQPQNHQILVQSDQFLLAPPVMQAPAGTLQGVMVDTGNGLTFSQDLRVHDDDPKGSYAFDLTSATNLAGRPTGAFVGDVDYELGGFVSRTIEVPPFSDLIDLGVNVSDPSKLDAKDKDLIAMSFVPDFTEGLQLYTIVDDSAQLDLFGDHLHWNDSQAVGNNSTGQATITIEELV